MPCFASTVFAMLRYVIACSSSLPLSCSIGIALSPEHGRTYFELFNKADQALYRAKEKGKNSFVIYDEADIKKHLRKGQISAVNNRIDSNEEPGLAEDNLVRYAFQRLYTSGDVEKSVNDILELVGRKMNVSRVYIFENSDDNRFCNNTFEWCNGGITPEIQNLQGISYEEDIAGYVDMFDEQGIFYCPDINELPENIYNIVAPQGIKSLLHCAIRDNGVFRGYIGFDECTSNYLWTQEQIDLLYFLSQIVSVFLLKKRGQEKNSRLAANLQTLIDSQNAWIYVIDPETFRLKYMNQQTRALSPQIEENARCHEVLRGLSEPCENCPVRSMDGRRKCSTLIHNDHLGITMYSEAAKITWDGKEAYLITSWKTED